MSEGAKATLKKLGNAFMKTFRGLIAEKKDGEWEMSKGNCAFWLFNAYMLPMWANGLPVPELMFYGWLALLTYSGVKHTKGSLTEFVASVKSKA